MGYEDPWIEAENTIKASQMLEWTSLYFNMKQKVWTLALILAIMKAKLEFLHGETDEDGILEGNPLNFTSSKKLSMKPHPPMGASGNSFPHGTSGTPLPPI